MRTEACPICHGRAEAVLTLDLGPKPPLASRVAIRHCALCAFAFVASGDSPGYDAYYASVTNDACHREVEGADSPSAEQAALLVQLAGSAPPRVLDFGCGSGDLLAELARAYPRSRFVGCDISAPALVVAQQRLANFPNAAIVPVDRIASQGPFDLVILSHVLEHLLDFNMLALLRDMLAEAGRLYVEVPDARRYEHRPRLEFLYYFDRLHVNHFSPHALAATAAPFGLALVGQMERDFRYRDGWPYPAVGALFARGPPQAEARSPPLGASLERYIAGERARFADLAQEISQLPGVLVWGAGDNFHRAASSGGPLSSARQMRLIDRRRFKVAVGGTAYETEPPEATIGACGWPVVITVSEHRSAIQQQALKIDPSRRILFV